ncbi:MAG: SBBP repeat-containing protein [Campylobacterales bacterium]|nr:SBBP repeat-containing protein [Campylobacterales bacterium]
MKPNPYNYGSVFKILSKGRVSLVVSALLASSTLIHAAPAVNTLPTGGTVASGSATISQNANAMNIVQTTDKVILNWQSFSIGQNASVNFAQPSSSSIALNRVSGGVSEIFGSLSANGKVFLINPNGIIFGQNAKVDVGGMVASTMNIKDADFLSGNYAFTRDGATGKILNQGELKAKLGGYIALLSPDVQNEGIITAQKGSIAMGAGDSVTLNISGDKLIGISVEGAAMDTLISNKQLVEAEGGLILMSSKAANALYSSTINNTGVISANSISEDGGEIRLIASGGNSTVNNKGIVTADGANGGFVAMAATNVIADDNSFSVAPNSASGEFGWYYIGDKTDYAQNMRNPNLSGSGTPSEYPVLFNKNDGQFTDGIAYQAMGQKTSVALSAADAAAYFAVGDSAVGFGFDNANMSSAVGEDAKNSYSNYYTNGKVVEHSIDYGKVRYKNIYSGIDLVYYTNKKGEVEHDLYVSAGADASTISYDYKGASVTKLANGDISIKNGDATITQLAPLSYQNTAKGKKVVASEYELKANGKAGIKILDSYDKTKTLVVDPTVSYISSKTGYEFTEGVAIDINGNTYITGNVGDSLSVLNPSQPAYGGGQNDAFVTKLNSSGQKVYSTYLGGYGDDQGKAIAVDANGNAYITGDTYSTNFPVLNAFQTTKGGATDAFVTKLSSNGAISYSTYLGGSGDDYGNDIAVDTNGNAYITGKTTSTNFTILNAWQSSYRGGQSDAFVTKLNSSGQKVYSTYLGGNGSDSGNGIAVDTNGNAYITGDTWSSNFPTLMQLKSYDGGGRDDIFVTKLDPNGTLSRSTYLGGSRYDYGNKIAVDNNGNIYITGGTDSTDFQTMNAAQSSFGGGQNDAFVIKLNSNWQKIYVTYLGGNNWDEGLDIAVDGSGNAYITGMATANQPLLNNIFPLLNPVYTNGSGFITKLDPNGQKAYSSYLQNNGDSIAVDSSGNAYIAEFSAYNGLITKISPIDYTYQTSIKLADHTTVVANGTYGTAYSLYANLSASGGNLSSGTVTWYNGATVLGSVNIAGGTASASAYLDLSSTYLNAGTYSNLYYKYSVTGISKAYSAFTIAPKTITVSSATANNKVYDGGTSATVSGYNVAGLIGAQTLGFSSTANFLDAIVGTGKTVNVTNITLSNGTNGGIASNYQLSSTSTTTTADITPAPTPPSPSPTPSNASMPSSPASLVVMAGNAGVVLSNAQQNIIVPNIPSTSSGVIYGAPAVNLNTDALNVALNVASAASVLVPSSPATLAANSLQTYTSSTSNQSNNIQTYSPVGISWLTPSASYLGNGNSIMSYADGSLPNANISSYNYSSDISGNVRVPTTTFYNPANPRNSYQFSYMSFQLGNKIFNGLTNQYGGYIDAKTGVWHRNTNNGFGSLVSTRY